MDIFSIGASIKGAMNTYFTHMRGTGRTQALLALVQTGDRVIFSSTREALDFKKEAQRMDKDIICISVAPTRGLQAIELTCREVKCNTYFDHMWLQDYYCLQHEIATKDLRQISSITKGEDPYELR